MEIRTAPPDREDGNDKHLDLALSSDTTFGCVGVIHGDLSPECAAMVRAVPDALSVPRGPGDLRTWPQRYHDAPEEEALRRLLASDILPKAGRTSGQGVAAPRGAVLYRLLSRQGWEEVSQTAEVLAMLEHQILAQVIQVVSGPGGVASSCAATSGQRPERPVAATGRGVGWPAR